MTSHAVGSDALAWQEDRLHVGEVYLFHVVAINAIGKSGKSPALSTLAVWLLDSTTSAKPSTPT